MIVFCIQIISVLLRLGSDFAVRRRHKGVPSSVYSRARFLGASFHQSTFCVARIRLRPQIRGPSTSTSGNPSVEQKFTKCTLEKRCQKKQNQAVSLYVEHYLRNTVRRRISFSPESRYNLSWIMFAATTEIGKGSLER